MAGEAALVSALGEGEPLWFVGTLAIIKVPGEAVGGRFDLTEFLFPQHASPPKHTHPQDESFVVLEGELTVEAGEERFEAGPGRDRGVPGRGRTHLPGGQRDGAGAGAEHARRARAALTATRASRPAR